MVRSTPLGRGAAVMSALADRWTNQRSRSSLGLSFVWGLAGAAGGFAGGLVPHPLLGAVLSAALVGLVQALTFRPDLRYGAAWFGASAAAGAIGFAAFVVGALALAGVAGEESPLFRQGLLAWIALGAAGGLLLGAAQAPLTGRRGLALTWCGLGLLGGAVLWPAGFAIGRRFWPELADGIADFAPQLTFLAAEPAGRAASFAMAWLLYVMPFGMLVASRSGGR
jgi:hypothetical protein